MRVSDNMITDNLLNYIQQGESSIYDLQSQISSGLTVARPSDDPAAYSLIRANQVDNALAQQYQVNTNSAQSSLNTLDSTMQNMTNIMQRVSEIVTTGSDGTQPASGLSALGTEVNQYLEQMVSMANSSSNGHYIYGGTQTDKPPYVVTRDSNGQITGVTYEGNQDSQSVEVGKGSYVPVNLAGSDTTSSQGLFQSDSTDMFNDLINIRNRLMNGENLAQSQDCTADPGTDTINVSGICSTGSTIQFSSTGTLPAGLQPNVNYYAIRVSDTEIKVAATLADARAGTAIDLTDAGTGQMSVVGAAVTDVSNDNDQISMVTAKVGAYEQRVTTAQSLLTSETQEDTTNVQNEGAVNVAKAATELSNQQNAYQAALSVTAKSLQTSLLNYM